MKRVKVKTFKSTLIFTNYRTCEKILCRLAKIRYFVQHNTAIIRHVVEITLWWKHSDKKCLKTAISEF